MTGCTSSGLSGNNTSKSKLCLGGCVYFKCCNVFSVRGRISFFMLSVTSLIPLWNLLLLILRLSFFDIYWWLMLYWKFLDISELFQLLLATPAVFQTPKAPFFFPMHLSNPLILIFTKAFGVTDLALPLMLWTQYFSFIKSFVHQSGNFINEFSSCSSRWLQTNIFLQNTGFS